MAPKMKTRPGTGPLVWLPSCPDDRKAYIYSGIDNFCFLAPTLLIEGVQLIFGLARLPPLTIYTIIFKRKRLNRQFLGLTSGAS